MSRREDEILEDIKRLGEQQLLVLENLEVGVFRIIDLLGVLVAHFVPQTTTAVLSVGGAPMATVATITFAVSTDPTVEGPPPTGDGQGIVVTFSSDNPAVSVGTASVGTDPDTATAPITGTEAFNLSAVVANVSGAPLLDNDGVTPFVQPEPVAVPAAPAPQTTTAVLSAD